jgi:hypothetical protein
MKIRKATTADGREVNVIEGVKWAKTGERGIVVDGLFIVAPTPTRAEASERLDRRMRELVASGQAVNMRQALDFAMKDDPDAAEIYRG